jgi:hypothetical protein
MPEGCVSNTIHENRAKNHPPVATSVDPAKAKANTKLHPPFPNFQLQISPRRTSDDSFDQEIIRYQ